MKVTTPGKVYAYARVSLPDQAANGISLLAQEADMQKVYEQAWKPRGYGPFRIFRDEGVSAYTRSMDKRPEGNKLLTILRPGDVVMFYKIDRAFRSIADGTVVMNYLQKKGIIVVVLDIGNGTPVDTTTPTGLLLVTMLITMGQIFSMQSGERVKTAHDYNLKTRGWSVRPLPGHMIYKNNQNKRIQKVDEVYCASSEDVLTTLWTEGPESLLKKLRKKEIRLIKRMGTRDTEQRMYHNSLACAIPRYFKLAVLALYFTGRLKDFAAKFNRPVESFFKPEEKLIINPQTQRWHNVLIAKTSADISGAAA